MSDLEHLKCLYEARLEYVVDATLDTIVEFDSTVDVTELKEVFICTKVSVFGPTDDSSVVKLTSDVVNVRSDVTTSVVETALLDSSVVMSVTV